jgi:hypothetical protein
MKEVEVQKIENLYFVAMEAANLIPCQLAQKDLFP